MIMQDVVATHGTASGVNFSVLAKRLAGKSISKMIYFVASGTFNLDLIQSSVNTAYCKTFLKSPSVNLFQLHSYVYKVEGDKRRPFPANVWFGECFFQSHLKLGLRSWDYRYLLILTRDCTNAWFNTYFLI